MSPASEVITQRPRGTQDARIGCSAPGLSPARKRSPPRPVARTVDSQSESIHTITSPNDLQFDEPLGEGSWSTVMKAVNPRTRKVYAVKIVSKALLRKENMAAHAIAERDALLRLSRSKGGPPGFVCLYATFQDVNSLYYVLSLAPKGDLKSLVKKYGSLSLDCTRYYTAQIVDAVQWMHLQGVVHRDLKPDNVLLDEHMRIKIADFGSAYVGKPGELGSRKSTFVGTAAYVAPELLLEKATSKSSDIWAIGTIVYHLLLGKSPFMAPTEYLTFLKVKAVEYVLPDTGFDEDARDLLSCLLVRDPLARLGIDPKSSPSELRRHTFFVGHTPSSQEKTEKFVIDWDTLWTIPPLEIESGLIPPPPPIPEEFWDGFVHEFSLIDVGDQDGSESTGDSDES